MKTNKITSLLSFAGYSRELEVRHRFTYIINVFSTSCVLLFLLFYLFFVPSFTVNLITSLCLAAMLSVFALLKIRLFNAARILMISGFFIQEFLLVFLWFPKETNLNYFLFIVAPISFFIYDFKILKERRVIIGINIIAIVMLILSEQVYIGEPVISLSPFTVGLFSFFSILSTIPSIFIVFFFYATNLSRTHHELELLANTDSLTSIYNRRTLFREGNLLFGFCRKYNKDFTLLLLDVDYFKRINDTYGHPAGDRALVLLTELLHQSIRQNDILARYGGEEFVIVIKDSESACSSIIAEKLREKIEHNDFVISDDITLNITVSVGVSCYNEKSESFEQIIRKADKALYTAKTSGRNNVKISI